VVDGELYGGGLVAELEVLEPLTGLTGELLDTLAL
jgi:hypothetical protein